MLYPLSYGRMQSTRHMIILAGRLARYSVSTSLPRNRKDLMPVGGVTHNYPSQLPYSGNIIHESLWILRDLTIMRGITTGDSVALEKLLRD